MRLPSRTKPGTDDLGDWVNGLRRTGCDDPQHEQWRARAEVAEAELKQAVAERDAAQAQLAKHLHDAALPRLGIVWDEPIPDGAGGLLDDWPDVPGDRADMPERIETGGQD